MFRKSALSEQPTKDKKWLTCLNNSVLKQRGDIQSVAVSSKADRILIGSVDGILVLDKRTLKPIQTLKPEPRLVPAYGNPSLLVPDYFFNPLTLSFSEDGKSFLCWDNSAEKILLWDLTTGTYQTVKSPTFTSVHDLIFIDDTLALAITKKDFYFSHISYLDLTSGVVEKEWLLKRPYNDIAIISNSFLLCSSGLGHVDIYDIHQQILIKSFATGFPVYKSALSHDQKYLVCSGYKNAVVVYDFATTNYVKSFDISSAQANDFSISLCDNYLAVAEYTVGKSYQGNLVYFDFETGKRIAEVSCGNFLKYVFMDHDEKTLLTVDNDSVKLIQYETSKPGMSIKSKAEPIDARLFKHKSASNGLLNIVEEYLGLTTSSSPKSNGPCL